MNYNVFQRSDVLKYLEYRLASGLTQEELAAKVGVSKSYISQLETTKKQPSVKLLIHIAVALNTCPCVLINFNHIASKHNPCKKE